VDGGKARLIFGVLVAPSEVSENKPMLNLLWRTHFRWKVWPRQATGVSKYDIEENIVAIENQHTHAYIPLPDYDHRTEFFSSLEFTYDTQRDFSLNYLCSAPIYLFILYILHHASLVG
jgi:hypothetical protein